MNRRPIYHKQDQDYRVVYRPHSRWVAQRWTEAKPTREHDSWEDLHGPVESRERAIDIMHQRKPLRGV